MISVIICTHNPRPEFWSQTIAGLRAQTLANDEWELIVVDNASRPGAVAATDLVWQPRGRVLVESRLGLTHARLRGIAEAKGELLVFVDDDNVLAEDYLAQAKAIAGSHAFLGAFGGHIEGRFESPPPSWARPYLQYLAITDVRRISWSNAAFHNPSCPCGAGMCVRRSVAVAYASAASHDANRRALGRIGESLSACEDSDLALTACDLGLGVGLFPQLRMQHLMTARRVELGYLCALVHGNHRSQVILGGIRGAPLPAKRTGRLERLVKFYQRLRLTREARLLDEAVEQGRRAGIEFVEQHLGPARAQVH